jgi:hypothetical protein
LTLFSTLFFQVGEIIQEIAGLQKLKPPDFPPNPALLENLRPTLSSQTPTSLRTSRENGKQSNPYDIVQDSIEREPTEGRGVIQDTFRDSYKGISLVQRPLPPSFLSLT